MGNERTDTIRSYAEELIAAASRFRNAEAMMLRRRTELFTVMRAVFTEPGNQITKAAMARITGYTREHVNRIVNGD